MKRGNKLIGALVAVAVVASACGGTGSGGSTAGTSTATATPTASAVTRPDVIVGSTNFYEQITLGELYSQILEANGYKVTRKFNLGNREIVEPAIESGQIDVDAEYLATLLAFVDKNGTISKPTTDPRATQIGLQKALDPKGLTVLDYAAATDQNGFVVTQATASSKSLKKLSDLAPIGNTLVLGGPPECPQRPFCQLGLKNTYGITFKDFKPLQLADNIAPVVRNALLNKDDGTLPRLLDAISAKLTQAELNDMNKQVAVDKADSKAVAAAWLKKQGLIK